MDHYSDNSGKLALFGLIRLLVFYISSRCENGVLYGFSGFLFFVKIKFGKKLFFASFWPFYLISILYLIRYFYTFILFILPVIVGYFAKVRNIQKGTPLCFLSFFGLFGNLCRYRYFNFRVIFGIFLIFCNFCKFGPFFGCFFVIFFLLLL